MRVPSPVVRAFPSVAALLLTASTLLAQAAAPARFEARTSSDAARAAFREAMVEQQNVGGPRILAAADRAVRLDPQFAMGRAFQAFARAGTAEARAEAIGKVINTMGSAPPIELLFATYLRENAAGRGAAALPILRMVGEMAPGDPEIAYYVLNAELVGRSVPDQIAARRAFAAKFPTHGAVHDTLAYQIATTDPQAALAEVGEYVRLLPNHPNAHDSFADILLLAWDRKFNRCVVVGGKEGRGGEGGSRGSGHKRASRGLGWSDGAGAGGAADAKMSRADAGRGAGGCSG